MSKNSWNFIRLALLWARKGGLSRKRLDMLSKVTKKLLHHSNGSRGALIYGEREFSFDDTPIIHVKMHRPTSLRFKLPHFLPCINPAIDFEYDFKYDEDDAKDDNERCNNGDEMEGNTEDEASLSSDEGIDSKADKFIAKFYEQMKLQKQISYLEYNEMP